MTGARLLARSDAALQQRHQHDALDLAGRLPGLLLEAKQIAASVVHGVHGRRRAGMGENFWQFRPFVSGEPAQNIDWRRSAKDDRVYIREREWEAAQSVWIWMDMSPSMAFVSKTALAPKIDRALVLGLALADLLVRGGERVGIPGLIRPIAHQQIVERLAQALIIDAKSKTAPDELPPGEALASLSQAVLFSDFLSLPQEIARRIEAMAIRGAQGHLVAITDPVEETFPFSGHTEFSDVDSPARLRAGRAEDFREDYRMRLATHRDALREAAQKHGWSFTVHHTDRPASEALLRIAMRLGAKPVVGT
ncbi:DUF58 domain-containing protein [Methylovirgula sp. 4M-Z18]|uniref:DUF58 domain-containing protein n=1 Tax=Methylovirgula sp. 4M-Z18 TaxID=2293567 RepID=UPI000E2E86FE|nr:DUF58 domain-containing protein [Methylovirgula sp. 4M-Z18]RFB79292.1 DUF58 domain-containing protein [Methylovirgula sp. 4M-Z18]